MGAKRLDGVVWLRWHQLWLGLAFAWQLFRLMSWLQGVMVILVFVSQTIRNLGHCLEPFGIIWNHFCRLLLLLLLFVLF